MLKREDILDVRHFLLKHRHYDCMQDEGPDVFYMHSRVQEDLKKEAEASKRGGK